MNPAQAPSAGVERAWTLASNYYTDAAFLPLERERIFCATWQCVGWAEQAARPGQYFTFDLAGEPLLIVRGADGILRGFYNVCRHRAGPPAEGCGERKVFRCGYHGWTYSLDGRLLNAPEMEGAAEFEHGRFGLVPIHVGEWAGLIFANLSHNPEPLVDSLGELPRQAAKFRIERMKFYRRHDYVMACNWKTYIDNYMEGYHLPSVHPSLNRELDYGAYEVELFPHHSLQYSPIRAGSRAEERRYAESGGELRAEYFWIYPNWMLNCYPDNVSLNIVLPVAPEQCVAIFAWFFPEELLGTGAPEKTFRFSDEIQQEDGRMCEIVQRNLRSRSYSRGRYSPKQEKSLHHFHALYAREMTVAPQL
ncbi:MAG: aromatic ring-hydroxylating oxygenase subunit alpha [Terriglobales bacterium]